MERTTKGLFFLVSQQVELQHKRTGFFWLRLPKRL